MRPFEAPSLLPIMPEMILAGLVMALLVLGVMLNNNQYRIIARLAVLSLIAVGVVVFQSNHDLITTFNGMFISDPFAIFMKLLVIIGAGFALIMAGKYMERERINRFEYPVLVLLSVTGMMLMISANDLISLYMALELQSLPLYVMAALKRYETKSTEAGLKYFVLGALSSGLLLYGASLIYGFTGATGFAQIAEAMAANPEASLGVVTGMVLLAAGLAFKISAVPFHMWAPDVYEGAPTAVVAFFAIAPKVAALALILRLFLGPFGEAVELWQQIIIFIAAASMILGAVAAVVQTNIKRLLAYSSIGHMGYALMGLAVANKAGIEALLVYISIYVVMSIGTFAVVLMMKKKDKMVENISDLAGVAKDQPLLALAMSIMMFSMAGIPPLAGFFGKLFIFQSAVAAGFYTLAVIGVLASVVGAYYYLRIIKVMYFDDAEETLDKAEDTGLNAILVVTSLVAVLFIVYPTPLLQATTTATAALIK